MNSQNADRLDVTRNIWIAADCFLLISLIFWGGCSKQPEKESAVVTGGELAEQVGDVAVLRLDAPAFSSLSLNDRIAAYYLSKAVMAGRDITYDQIHPRQVEIRRFLEEIGLNISYGALADYAEPFWVYLKSIWIYNGFYDLQSRRKLPPMIGRRAFDDLMYLAQSNSGGQLGPLKDVVLKRNWIIETLFNPAIESDLSAWGSSLRFYEGVSRDEAGRFPAKYPHNSRLVKRDDKLVELVYRTGDENLAPGPYAEPLEEIIECLGNARPYLPPQRVAVVDHLIAHFRTGQPVDYGSAAQMWRRSDSPVDFILGFNDRRLDPLHQKGLWTGLLFIADEKAQALSSKVSETGWALLKTFPGYRADLFSPYRGKIKAVQLISAIGTNGPLCPDSYYDPPFSEASEDESQCLIFTNVIMARAAARARHIDAKLCSNEEERELAQRYAADLALAEIMLKSIIESPSGPIKNSKEDQEILRQALNELACLWLVMDPEMVNLGLLSDEAARSEALRRFERKYRRVLSGQYSAGEHRESLAVRWIGDHLYGKDELLSPANKSRPDTSYQPDPDAIRPRIADLGQQIANQLAGGEFEGWGDVSGQLEPQWNLPGQKNVRRQTDRDGFFHREAFILPLVKAKTNPMGGITDVYLEQPQSFAAEMFQLGGWPQEKITKSLRK